MPIATFSPVVVRAGALVTLLAGLTACAPPSSTPQAVAQASQSPVLLSCPAGQSPLLRQVVVNGALVPQVECVTAPTAVASAYGQAQPPAAGAPGYPPPAPVAVQQAYAPAPVYAPVPTYVPVAAPAPVRAISRRPAARRAVYDDDVVEYREKKRRSWQKSALIIGSSAGVGAGVGAATGGKKGALIGAAVGGGAATVWDQITRR